MESVLTNPWKEWFFVYVNSRSCKKDFFYLVQVSTFIGKSSRKFDTREVGLVSGFDGNVKRKAKFIVLITIRLNLIN